MADITKKQIIDYMKTIDTGTANGKVVINQLKKALTNKESAASNPTTVNEDISIIFLCLSCCL